MTHCHLSRECVDAIDHLKRTGEPLPVDTQMELKHQGYDPEHLEAVWLT